MMGALSFRSEATSRGARMLRSALGPAIGAWLEDPAVVEVMLNPDGCLWIDRLTEGLADTGERFEGLLPPVVAAPAFAIRKPAVAVFTLADYVATGVVTADQAEVLRASVA